MESETTKRLNTFLPIDVFFGFTEFCKENAKTGLDKWDYGVGLRILLMKAAYADMLFDIDKRITVLEEKKTESQQEKTETSGYVKVKTWGDTTKLEDNKNE